MSVELFFSIILVGVVFLLFNTGSVKRTYENIDSDRLSSVIKTFNSSAEAAVISQKIKRFCKEYNINPYLVAAICQVESNFRTDKPGSAGEIGLMQIKPIALEQVHNLYPDLEYYQPYLRQIGYNLQIGTLYFKYCLDRAKGDLKKALGFYNNGFDNPNYEYAAKVLQTVKLIKAKY